MQKPDYKDSYVYEQIMSHDLKEGTKMTEEMGLSAAMRMFIHYAGDIHQPLHTASRFDKEFPKGDRGGNYFHIEGKTSEVTNLHASYDAVLYEFEKEPSLPFSNSGFDTFNSSAMGLMEKYPKEKLDNVTNFDYMEWAHEAF